MPGNYYFTNLAGTYDADHWLQPATLRDSTSIVPYTNKAFQFLANEPYQYVSFFDTSDQKVLATSDEDNPSGYHVLTNCIGTLKKGSVGVAQMYNLTVANLQPTTLPAYFDVATHYDPTKLASYMTCAFPRGHYHNDYASTHTTTMMWPALIRASIKGVVSGNTFNFRGTIGRYCFVAYSSHIGQVVDHVSMTPTVTCPNTTQIEYHYTTADCSTHVLIYIFDAYAYDDYILTVANFGSPYEHAVFYSFTYLGY